MMSEEDPFQSFQWTFHMIITKKRVSIQPLDSQLKGSRMKKKLIIVLIALGALFGSSTSAIAEEGSGQKAAITAWKAENKAKRDAYKQAIKTFVEAKKANAEARKAIATKFKSDADALRASTKVALEAATTTEAKKAAASAGKAALEKLIADRKAAIEALPVPTKPAKPTLAPKPVRPAPKTSASPQG